MSKKPIYMTSADLSHHNLTQEELDKIKVNPKIGYNIARHMEINKSIYIQGKNFICLGEEIALVSPNSPLKKFLKKGDILCSINDYYLSYYNDAKVFLNQKEQVVYSSMDQFIKDGEEVELRFLTPNKSATNTNRGEISFKESKVMVPMNFLYEIRDAKLIARMEKSIIINLPTRVKAKLFNQDHAVDEIFNSLKVFFTGLKESDKPVGSYLLTGLTGTGKTEIAKQFAEQLNWSFVRIDMSEFSEKHTVARLIGSPAGYVGFGEQTILEKEISNDGRKLVLLLDEIEKAHPELQKIFLQAFDNARITLSNGVEIDFSNTLILMTSNLGVITKSDLGLSVEAKQKIHTVNMAEIKKWFVPEFIGRLSGVIEFNPLNEDHAKIILEKFVSEFNSKQMATKGANVILTQECKDYIIQTGFDKNYGARPLKNALHKKIYHKIADLYLFEDEDKHTASILVDFIDNDFKVSFIEGEFPDLPENDEPVSLKNPDEPKKKKILGLL